MDCLYLPDGDDFVATELTRGPWSHAHQHGGPPAALLARQLERRLADESGGDAFHPARVTIELLRPLPIGRMSIETTTVRPGRKVRGLAATCTMGGEPVARATALFLRRSALEVTANAGPPASRPDEAAPHGFGFFTAPVGYHTAMEFRAAAGRWGSGAMTVWMRLRVPVVPDEAPSPLQRVLVAADSGNGISAALDPRAYTFLNADLTVSLHRVPEGEWVCLDARTTVSPGGIGLADTVLLDEHGGLGRALQSLVVAPTN